MNIHLHIRMNDYTVDTYKPRNEKHAHETAMLQAVNKWKVTQGNCFLTMLVYMCGFKMAPDGTFTWKTLCSYIYFALRNFVSHGRNMIHESTIVCGNSMQEESISTKEIS